MSGRTPTWGSLGVIGLGGFAGGLLVAAVLVAGRTPPRPAQFIEPAPAISTEARPATVTVTGAAPAPSTVIEHLTSPPVISTAYLEVTITPTETSTSSPTSTTTLPTDPRVWPF